MKVAEQQNPLRIQSSNLVLEELPNELMIYDPERKKAFCLNKTAALVWRHSDGRSTISEIAEKIAKEGYPANEDMVLFALNVLSKDGLLASSPTAVPSAISRRALLQKMGVGAAAAVPLVTVLFVNPARAHASSTPPINNPSGPSGPTGSDVENTPGYKMHPGGFWYWLENIF